MGGAIGAFGAYRWHWRFVFIKFSMLLQSHGCWVPTAIPVHRLSWLFLWKPLVGKCRRRTLCLALPVHSALLAGTGAHCAWRTQCTQRGSLALGTFRLAHSVYSPLFVGTGAHCLFVAFGSMQRISLALAQIVFRTLGAFRRILLALAHCFHHIFDFMYTCFAVALSHAAGCGLLVCLDARHTPF